MKNYNAENHAKCLPDIYSRTTASNNYKILEVERQTEQMLRDDLQDIDDILCLDNAYGKTLDLYGERLGQSRGLATDAQYLLMLRAKIMRSFANGSYDSIINSVCSTFECEPSSVTVEEDTTPCVVKKLSVPLSIVNRVGLSSSQVHQIMQSLLPIGIRLDEYLLEGTFTFGTSESDYDTDAGFALAENAGETDVGGYFGATGSDSSVLPID